MRPSPRSCAREAGELHVPTQAALVDTRQSGTRGGGVRSGVDTSGTFFCTRGRAPRTTRCGSVDVMPRWARGGDRPEGAGGDGAQTREGAISETPWRPH